MALTFPSFRGANEARGIPGFIRGVFFNGLNVHIYLKPPVTPVNEPVCRQAGYLTSTILRITKFDLSRQLSLKRPQE